MAPARVAVGAMASVASGSITPAFGATTTAGNCLVLYVCQSGSGINAPTLTGWTLVTHQEGAVNSIAMGAAVYVKPNCSAAETAPTIAWSSATQMWAKLEEWSGMGTTDPTDRVAASQAVTSLTMIGADATTTDVLVAAWAVAGTKSATITVGSPTVSPGTPTSTSSTDDGTTKALIHAYMWSGIMSANSAADSFTPSFTPSTGTVASDAVIVSFKPPTTRKPMSSPIVLAQGVTRAGVI